MARYTVHTPGTATTRESALEGARFIPDGWSWGAFFFGPLWLLWHRHWVTGLLVLVAEAMLFAGLSALAPADGTLSGAILLVSLLFGLEGASLRRLALAKAGYGEVALVAGPTLESAEHRYFAHAGEAEAPRASVSLPGLRPAGVIGLFPDARQP